jgi:4-amino-4-deoxy-L-arabinose transferase-like glycosyltransferase
MKRARELVLGHADALLAVGLFLGYLVLLLGSAGSLGFMRDEGFYFAAARSYADWFRLLARDPGLALSLEAVQRYWSVNSEHPGLMKSLFALSNLGLSGLFSETSSSFRFPAMVFSSAAVALVFWWGKQAFGRAAGLLAALSFAFMPRVFFHAHLACFDLPVCTLWLVTSYVYSRSLSTPTRAWVVSAGVAYGLFLDTKHNSWIFPFALLLHFLLTQLLPLGRELRAGRSWWRCVPPAWLSMAALGPLVLLALWPWLWRDTLAHFQDYVGFHLHHDYYNMEFLGRTYWQPPMPRAYAWLMTLATVPFVTLLLGAIGIGAAALSLRPQTTATASAAQRSDYVLWAVSIAASYAPWLSTSTPIFGGTKHWLTAYPFLCLFAGLGFVKVREAVVAWQPRLAHPALLGACLVVAPVAMALHAHPFGLSAYTPIVGGAPGAASLGLNRTFWGYTTQSLAPYINQNAPRHASVYLHDTAVQSFQMFLEDGRLRSDLRGSLDIAASDVALYHHEPHMARVEHQIWMMYGTVSPDAIATYDGVPIAWVYLRHKPEAPR